MPPRLFARGGAVPLAEWMIAYFVPLLLYASLHPSLMRLCGAPSSGADDGVPSRSAAGRAFAWAVFSGSVAAAVVGGVLGGIVTVGSHSLV